MGYASPVVAHGNVFVVGKRDFYALAGVHLELVYGVVDCFLEQHVNAVLGVRAVAQASDVHSRTCAYVLDVGEVAYALVGVFGRLL